MSKRYPVVGTGSRAGMFIRALAIDYRNSAPSWGFATSTRAANATDGASSILTGIAARISIETGKPVDISSLVKT